MITLKDIAEITNVSVSTVSRVLNDKGNISRETRKKVLKSLEELWYKTGATMQKFNGISHTIGIYVPKSNEFMNNDPSTSIDINSLKEEIEKLGNKVIITTNSGELERNTVAYHLIDNREIHGAIICDPFRHDEYFEMLIKKEIPYIITNGFYRGLDHNYVDYDNYDGAAQVMNYLYESGHKTIGIISGPSDRMVSINRMDGCIDAASKNGMIIDESYVNCAPFDVNGGYESAKILLSKYPDLSAIFAFSDSMAFGAMKAIRECGLRVPDDISIVGFDDTELSQYTDPPLTTVARFRYDISSLIARSVNDLILNNNIKKINIVLKTEIIIRNSCKRLQS